MFNKSAKLFPKIILPIAIILLSLNELKLQFQDVLIYTSTERIAIALMNHLQILLHIFLVVISLLIIIKPNPVRVTMIVSLTFVNFINFVLVIANIGNHYEINTGFLLFNGIFALIYLVLSILFFLYKSSLNASTINRQLFILIVILFLLDRCVFLIIFNNW